MDINKRPNLEDLLKVKKAEQPDDAFWEKFDNDLEKRTLQAFIGQEPWYRSWANQVMQFARSPSMAFGFVLLMGIALYINMGFDRNLFLSDINSQDQNHVVAQEVFNPGDFNDYAVVDNNTLEKDYAVEVISIEGASETYDFGADAISVAIGDTVDYSDSPVYASSDIFRNTNQYTQLASFAF